MIAAYVLASYPPENPRVADAIWVAIGALVAWFLLSGKISVRQRTLWLAFFVVVAATTVIWDAIEVRIYDGRWVYWRSDWDWEGGGGGATEVIALTALVVGPPVAAAIAYSSAVLAASRRTSAYLLYAPLSFVLAQLVAVAIVAHPLLFYSERPT